MGNEMKARETLKAEKREEREGTSSFTFPSQQNALQYISVTVPKAESAHSNNLLPFFYCFLYLVMQYTLKVKANLR